MANTPEGEKVPSKGQPKYQELEIEHGRVGTPLFYGLLDVEFNPDLKFPESLEIYDSMRKGDSTCRAVLAALKEPILSAKHYIQAGGKEPQDLEIAEFIRGCLFERLSGGYMQFAREALTCLDFGFKYFEKIFGVDDDGHVYWKRFASRAQTAHYKWSMDSNPIFVDGHPVGITQQLPGYTDDMANDSVKTNQPETPWDKLILFTMEQEGNNYEGISILRSAYKHWFYKDLLYKIQGISAERFGVGIPVAKYKSASRSNRSKLEELVKNIRSNEKAYAVLDMDTELDILIPKGDPKAAAIEGAISHHDRKIYDSILAGFLNLSTGDGGSNALSKDQSGFFLRSLVGLADYFREVMCKHIKELVDLNYQNVEKYPTLEIAGIDNTNVKEYIESIGLAVTAKAVKLTSEDEVAIRERLSLPSRTVEEIDEDKENEPEPIIPVVPVVPGAPAPVAETPKKDEEEPEEDMKKKMAEETPLKPTARERDFNRRINEFESLLEDKYSEYDDILTRAEELYKKVLVTTYEGADTIRKDGVVVFDTTPKNRELLKMSKKAINSITEKLQARFVKSPLQERLFAATEKMAVANVTNNETHFAEEIEVDKSMFAGFVNGYISNMEGVLYNEPRRILETVDLNFASQVSLSLAVKQAEGLKFNRNIFKLSTISHARSLYTSIVMTESVKQGFNFFKVVVPSSKIKDVTDSGMMAGVLFGIYTVAQLNKRISEQTDGKNASAVNGLGLHHGSFEYYYPIASDQLDEEEKIAKEQKKQWK